MQHADAEWDDRGRTRSRQTVDGPAEALRLCEEIEARGVDHVLVSFTTPRGVFFAIGLGGRDSCALYWESADPPYFQSHGGQATPDGRVVTYLYGGQPTEIPASASIPLWEAKTALKEFMTTGRRPEAISWDET